MKLFALVLIVGLAGSCLAADASGSTTGDSTEDRTDTRLTCEQFRQFLSREGASTSLTCNDDGSYPEYRCRNETHCVCLNREFGSITGGPYTRAMAQNSCERGDADCEVRVATETMTLPHGAKRMRMEGDDCSTCICSNGNITCTSTTCPSKATCTHMGRTLLVGESVMDGCVRCTCVEDTSVRVTDGDAPVRVVCPKTDCPDEPRQCMCDDAETEPVCYQGATYRNRCLLQCREVVEDLVTASPCQDRDTCISMPCSAEQVCHRRQYTCMLSPNDCRYFNCSDTCDDLAAASRRVCSNDGTTHVSRCHLERARSANASLRMRYEGACNDTRCPDGAVCGVDGVTYRSRCDLRHRNVRLDYNGTCKKDPKDVTCPRTVCSMNKLVKSLRSVCPICGGVVNVAVNRMELTRVIAARAARGEGRDDEYLDSLSGLAKSANESIPLMYRLSLISRCQLLFDAAADQMEIIYQSEGVDAMYCRDAAKILSVFLNEGRVASTDDKLETGSEMTDMIPAYYTSNTNSEFSNVMQTTSTSFTEGQLLDANTGSNAATTIASLFTVVVFGILGLAVNV